MSDLIDTIPLMKWQAEQKGYTCNDCYLSMQNCHDRSICCEDETGLCDYFEEMPREDTVRRQDAIDAALTFLVEYCGAAFDEDMQKKMRERLNELPSAEPEQRWIPVSDSPKKDGRYLVTRLDYVTDTKFADILWYEENTWWNRRAIGDYAVIAWMPLPDPYQEADHE